jgi:DNA repair exonuclease SbcCD ATPase subunit
MSVTPLFIIFDGPPSHESGRFVEVETKEGRTVHAAEWDEREDGLWSLGPLFSLADVERIQKASDIFEENSETCVEEHEGRLKAEKERDQVQSQLVDQTRLNAMREKAEKELERVANDLEEEFRRSNGIADERDKAYHELEAFRAALDPIRDWYEEGCDSMLEVAVAAIEDLQSDRAEVLKLRREQLEAMTKLSARIKVQEQILVEMEKVQTMVSGLVEKVTKYEEVLEQIKDDRPPRAFLTFGSDNKERDKMHYKLKWEDLKKTARKVLEEMK